VKLSPAIGWVVVRKELPTETTAGGIIKPSSALDREVGMQAGEECVCTVHAIPDTGAVGAYDDDSHVQIYPEEGSKVVVALRQDNLVPYWDDEFKPGHVTRRGQRVEMAQLYFVKLNAIVGVVETSDEEGDTEVNG
jgi:co-chaperonin GroES (HSP10)